MTCSSRFLSDLTGSEQMAVWTIRRLARPADEHHSPGTERFRLPCFRTDFAPMAKALTQAVRSARSLCGTDDISLPPATTLSPTEDLLLRATAEAQNDQEQGMTSLLSTHFMHPLVLLRFSDALMQLAACLAGAGYWLSDHRPARDARRHIFTPQPASAALSSRIRPPERNIRLSASQIQGTQRSAPQFSDRKPSGHMALA
ncbi:hypothetical protein LOC54_06440 [Acetobacter sp. AN02]|uniref:hypothetical protein n=1 Tax=Acetobacter sp. AN02 TaxID=2894186 RepID=UPI0024343C2B|nr:hypothetical protein [Acetobacter sp. AN02]MDG6094748.1 hypothetical protein [Acetobacter sp. AN02]